MDKIIKQIQVLVKKELNEEFNGHDYYHVKRVVELALKIARKEGGDKQVIELAGWLHDLGAKTGRKDHEIRSAKTAKVLLTKMGVETEIVRSVCQCILHHRYSTGTGKAATLEEKILQDADKLDVLGAIGIARTFVYGGYYKVPIVVEGKNLGTKDYHQTNRSESSLSHFYDKLFKIKSLLHTETARKIAIGRIKFLREFAQRLEAEINGVE